MRNSCADYYLGATVAQIKLSIKYYVISIKLFYLKLALFCAQGLCPGVANYLCWGLAWLQLGSLTCSWFRSFLPVDLAFCHHALGHCLWLACLGLVGGVLEPCACLRLLSSFDVCVVVCHQNICDSALCQGLWLASPWPFGVAGPWPFGVAGPWPCWEL